MQRARSQSAQFGKQTGIATAIALVLGLLLAVPAFAGPARLQSLIDLSGGPTLSKGKVILNDGGPGSLQITVVVVGGPPDTDLQVQFEGFKVGGGFAHYQVCTFTTDAGGSGGCHFNNDVGGGAAIGTPSEPLGPGGTITPGTYGPAFVVVCPFSVPPADAPDIFVSIWGLPGFPGSIVVP